jgi:HlyD family secretion protein
MRKRLSSIRSRGAVIIVLVIAVAAVAVWLYLRQNDPANGRLSASGTVETVDVQIAPEMTGRVVEVMVSEGDTVAAGDVLFRLDDALLQSQRLQAQASLYAAQDNLAAAQSGVEAAQAALKTAEYAYEAAQTNSDAQLFPARQQLQDLYDNAGVSRAAAQQVLSTATKEVRDAQYALDNFSVPSDQQHLTTLEALDVTLAKLAVARDRFEPYKYEDSGNQTRKDLKEALDEAQSAYDTAVRRLELETALSQAQEHQKQAMKDYLALQEGPKQEDIAALKAKIAALEVAPKQAESAVAQAETGVKQAQDRLAQAKSNVTQAHAALDLIDMQIQRSVVKTLSDGVVLARGIEPGSVVQAGSPVMSLGRLDELNITVYVPEDQYGRIKLGSDARVSVDSFPGRDFNARVTYISDQAEFTPRNVQTVEGRKSTVYAVRLTIANPDLSLKPGMPADVSFD